MSAAQATEPQETTKPTATPTSRIATTSLSPTSRSLTSPSHLQNTTKPRVTTSTNAGYSSSPKDPRANTTRLRLTAETTKVTSSAETPSIGPGSTPPPFSAPAATRNISLHQTTSLIPTASSLRSKDTWTPTLVTDETGFEENSANFGNSTGTYLCTCELFIKNDRASSER